ncbi:thiazole biosynthesis protein [Candidatus Erwinia haradaeae]|uniref:tRNA sulfurtransferase, partial n=1 Tax=Candidatus Erwinia haradaeae TaxID=1922217 RepID=A0A451D1W3_9GAMM|nr:thiazole biosynthesis protein [Candidatus Erwinia haradaeae]VFP79598.1 tRNA sulfurtransferase [Candidatus Erwinia haradaeae]
MPKIYKSNIYNKRNIEKKNNINLENITYVVLDIRTQDEQDKNPLYLSDIEVQSLPFYKLSSKFSTLDQQKFYLLYCDHGIMSRLHSLFLREKGFFNVQAYNSKKL